MKYEYRPYTIYSITLFKIYFISLASQLWKLKPSQLDFAHEMARACKSCFTFSSHSHIPTWQTHGINKGEEISSLRRKQLAKATKATRLRKCEPRQVPWQRQCNPRHGKHPQSLRSAWSRPDSTTLRVTERDWAWLRGTGEWFSCAEKNSWCCDFALRVGSTREMSASSSSGKYIVQRM